MKKVKNLDIKGCRFLFCTSRFVEWAGSEMLITEWSEFLLARGAIVTVFSHDVTGNPAVHIRSLGGHVTDDHTEIDLSNYNFVYTHHQTLAYLLGHWKVDETKPVPVFIYAHLSPFEPLELPLSRVEPLIADIVIANSIETSKRLPEFHPRFSKVTLFPNPAPESFFKVRKPEVSRLRRLLVISHHADPNVAKALEILASRGVNITAIGQHRKNSRRIIPADFENNDAVLSIGKSVQFGLAAQTPVYCYDHFGGPGWLNEENFSAAAEQNFSGRSHPNSKSPQEIADELQHGFASAQRYFRSQSENTLDAFRLEPQLAAIIKDAFSKISTEDRSEKLIALLKTEELRRSILIEGLSQTIYRREMLHRVNLFKSYTSLAAKLSPILYVHRNGRKVIKRVHDWTKRK
jgi:hypothetical protein